MFEIGSRKDNIDLSSDLLFLLYILRPESIIIIIKIQLKIIKVPEVHPPTFQKDYAYL
jgi:hypothetical protein